MNKIYLIILALLSSFSLYAQGTDPQAKKILDGVNGKMKSFKGVTANFTITSVSSKGKNNGNRNGKVSIKGQKYLLKQDKVEIICDGQTIWNFDGAKTITVSSVEESGSTLSPQNLLSNFYDKDFTYRLIGTKGNFHEIEMKPTDARKNFQRVNVFVDKNSSLITKARILDKSNNTVEFILSGINTNAALDDKLFTFNKARFPKDVEILD